jgi:hypothetical protein
MRCLRIVTATWLMIFGLNVFHGQEEGKPKVVVNEAPPPSERFPAAWYSSQEGDSTLAPVVGAPYTATMLLKNVMMPGRLPGGDKLQIKAEMVVRKMRDSAGRTRTEESWELEGYSNPAPTGKTYQVEVNDTVQHCFFRWVEPVERDEDKVATVNCLSRHVNWEEDGRMAISGQIEDVTQNKSSIRKMEPLGERQIEGLKAFGMRETTTELDSGGNPVRTEGGEVWWSPELHEIVQTRWIGESQMPTVELKDVKREEPPAALFYPPAGFKIVRADQAGH